MRKIRWLQTAAALALVAAAPAVLAADHGDSPGASVPDASADITDMYAWSEGENVLLVLDVSPFAAKDAKFSDAVQYVFHVESSAGYGKSGDTTNVICTFDASQKISCWVGDKDYVTGDASDPNGLKSTSGDVRVFAGPRADPFFFNLEGFKDAVGTVDALEMALMYDGAKCPTVDAANSMALVGMLGGTMKGTMPAVDAFASANVLSIVLEVKASLLTSGGTTLAVWSSTNKAGG